MLTLEQVEERRNVRYRRRGDLALRTVNDARKFVDDLGFCFLFNVKGYELPTLWEAINGCPRVLPKHHHDRALNLAWSWKDSLPSKGKVYYGKLIQTKPTLVSLSFLPYLYAYRLSETYGDPDDWRTYFEDGKMSGEAKRIYEVLLDIGPAPTSVLRRESGLYGHDHASKFDRALVELQNLMLIVMSGVSDSNRWKYCFIYDTLPRRFPDATKKALEISGRGAMEAIVLRYIKNVVATEPARIAKLFNWDLTRTERVIRGMVSSGLLQEAEIEGSAGVWLLTAPD